MEFFKKPEKPEDRIIAAISGRQSAVALEHYIGDIDTAFKNAFAKERRLCAFFGGYEASCTKRFPIQLMSNYEITLKYQEDAPDSLDDVIVDDGDFDVESLLAAGMPKSVTLVSGDSDSLFRRMQGIALYMHSLYEGYTTFNINTRYFKDLTSDKIVTISYKYAADNAVLRQLRAKAQYAARAAWRKILGRAKAPLFVKPFLAYSYLRQNCMYDVAALAEVEADPETIPSDAVPHLAYGPLVEGRGICSGLSWAFKLLMDEAGVPCSCISGYLADGSGVPHQWNLVKLDGQYYHVDATVGGAREGVFIAGFMKPDGVFAKTHLWEEERYPKATGRRFQYDFVEDFLAENGDDYLDAGADEDIMFPEKIIE